ARNISEFARSNSQAPRLVQRSPRPDDFAWSGAMLRPQHASHNATKANLSTLGTLGTAACRHPFGRFQHAVVARFDARILKHPSHRTEAVPEQFANRRRPARHAMDKSEIVDGF